MLQFHVLSFEGPDRYSRAGGIASRINGLTEGLATAEFETHLWFVGDPALPGHEDRGHLQLHRWCQWLSQHRPNGVYDGEREKADDYARSLPPFLMQEYLFRHLAEGGRAAVLAEEWHTVHAVLHLDWLLRKRNLRDRVEILWNANNTFGFEEIDWARLTRAANVTTVSRYMKHLMRPLGVDALVVPNGIEADALAAPDGAALSWVRALSGDRPLLVKMARFDPDKRWLLAMDTVAELKQRGRRPLMIARGGMEAHAQDVLARAREHGLSVSERALSCAGPMGLVAALEDTAETDVVLLSSPVDPEARRVLFRGATAVLANSGHEPFGLVGLEVMAAGGIACTGCTGEDYAVPGQNALVLETEDPGEFRRLFERLGADGVEQLRRQGRRTARQYIWDRVIDRALLPRIDTPTVRRPEQEPIPLAAE
jgi:glycosyltransferase involved in cell wall biosynthesis